MGLQKLTQRKKNTWTIVNSICTQWFPMMVDLCENILCGWRNA